MIRSYRRRIVALQLCLVLVLFGPGAGAAVIYVDLNNQSPTEDGSQQYPYRTIQAGIDHAVNGDRVEVAAGTYFESITAKDGVDLKGAGPGLTIIDGSGDPNSVVSFVGTRFNPRFEGFTVRGGSGDFIGTLNGVSIYAGGGIYVADAGPYITNTVVTDNVIDQGIARGAGIYVNVSFETPSIIGNTISSNTARSNGAGSGEGRGGGIFIQSKVTSVLVTDNVIEMNVADKGGGIYNKNLGTAILDVERNAFLSNEGSEGAAIFTTSFAGSETTISNNLFVGNGSDAGIKDCNDANGSSTPGAGEICNDGIDNDCDPETPDIFDADGDGSMCDVDCDDSDPTIGPQAPEFCSDMIDNDCDGNIDVSNPDNIVLVEFGSPMTYLGNEADPGLALTWTDPVFDDAAWSVGTYGVGYESNPPGADALFGSTVNAGSSSVYTRTLFEIENPLDVNALFLAADYDDGYAAWINGVEVFRSPEMPATGDPDWNTAALNGESSNGSEPDYGTLNDVSTNGLPALVAGTNVLAIGAWNDLNTSSDLVLVPRLSMSFGLDDTECVCADADGDGYACTDCDDTDPTIHPTAPELCNDGIDNDCDVATNDVFDADADGVSCVVDCDDLDPDVNPLVAEVYCDGIDNDCNPETPDVVDIDGDFADCTVDCNDNSPAIFPGQLEFCFDAIDNNCDGFIDDQDLECSCANPVDSDADGYRCTDCNDSNGAINPGVAEICNDGIDNDCTSQTPDVFDEDGDGELCDTDCEDFNPAVFTGAIEICNDGVDNDCDTLQDLADPDCAMGDGDGDGYDASVDCNDMDPDINPGAAEICDDGIDNDCDVNTLDLSDDDGDGYDCTDDCDDQNPAVNPGVEEACTDLVDNDCDGLIDRVQSDLVLIEFGSSMKYLANTSDPGFGLNWKNPFFNDAPWPNGLYGVGYQFGLPGSGAENLILTSVADDTISVYTRARFDITSTAAVNAMYLGADYDDGYVAWINGIEVYRSPEMPMGSPTWDADPELHESSNGTVPDYGTLIDISATAIPALVSGSNVFAVGVYNDIPDGGGMSSDLVVVPRLSMDFGDDDPDCLCADADNDGFSCSDCDDTEPLRNPGLTEIGCDGLDNDCDNQTDDLFDSDGDGALCDVDCDDQDPNVSPLLAEVPCDFLNNDCNAATFDVFDQDGDGFDCQLDCDESNVQVNPGMAEIGCDGIDNDCNTLTPDVADADFDGFRCDQDCNDDDPLVNPAAFEKCDDGIDNDCDGDVDGDDADCTCGDGDGDGYECLDCDDTMIDVHPAMTEICDDGIDNDCDPATLDVGDADGDGFDCLADCDDTNPFVRPNAVELCNDGIDNDCDPATPDIVDADGDTYSCDVDCNDDDSMINPGVQEVCADTIDNDCNASTVDLGDLDFDGVNCTFDCNDFDDTVSPNHPELCNDGLDNDCNPVTPDIFDGDGDGTACDLDCDDADATRGQSIAEQCLDGIDNDCDGDVDGDDADCACADDDMDGYACSDCDDTLAAINPGAAEVCDDGIDNDCNPATLDVDDRDGDGFACNEECDDDDPSAFPSGVEICGDGIDNDCNPMTPDIIDFDGDGHDCDVDCQDDNVNVNPGQMEIGCDGIDNDCDPMTSDLADSDGDGFTCVDGTVRGGAVSGFAASSSATVTIVNNTFVDNSMPSGIGGAIYLDDIIASDSAIVANNVFENNVAELGGAVVHTFFFGALSTNAFYGNTPGDLYDAGGSGMTRSGNLFQDPKLASTAAGNYRLAAGSPLIDAADPMHAPVNDIDRVARPYDGDFDMTALPDIGAYEWPSGEVLDLTFSGNDMMEWLVEDPGDEYNVYRGSLSGLRSQGLYTQNPFLPVPEQFCSFAAASLPFGDGFTPASGTVAIYLVTLRAMSFEGSLGNDGSGALRPNNNPCP